MSPFASCDELRRFRIAGVAAALLLAALLAVLLLGPGAPCVWGQGDNAATSTPVNVPGAPNPAAAAAAPPSGAPNPAAAAAAPPSGAPNPAAAAAAPPAVPPSAPAPGTARPAASPATPPAKRLFRLEGALPTEGSAQAVAINADESILAVAREDGGTVQIALYDRPSRTRIGLISAKVGSQPSLLFAPDQDRLLVAGTKAVQLWDVPIVPLKPDSPLDEKYRLWSQALSGGAAPQIAFADPPTQVLWGQGAALFRRETSAAGAPADTPAWRAGAGRGLSGFAFAGGGAGLALTFAGEKGVDLLDPGTLTLLGSLQGHRFPVAGAVPQTRGWLSLDTGWHLLRWSENLQLQESIFLESLPRAAEPAGLKLLGAKHVLIAVPGEGDVQWWVTSPPAWRLEDKLSAPAGGLAVSPTGRYVLALEGAKGGQVKLYGFAAPEAPLDYVRRLQARQAYRVAQSYGRLLDETGLSPKAKSALQTELSRVPVSATVQDLHERLARARSDGNADAIRHWAEQVLDLRPQDPDAVAALQDVKTLGERRILDQARDAIQQGQTAQAIAVLSSNISADSAVHEEAAALIRQAEALRRVAGLVGQARDQMNLGDFPAATALTEEALREDKDNAAARSLLSEIEERSGHRSLPRWMPIGAGMAIALAALGLLLHRNRGRWMPMFRRPGPAAAASWGGLGHGSLDDFGAAAAGPPPAATAKPGPRPAPRSPAGGAAEPKRASARPVRPVGRPERAESAPLLRPSGRAGDRAPERSAGRLRPARPEPTPARLQVVAELLQRTEDTMRLAQQADVGREHTALLMEWEAELAAFRRRLADPGVELGPLHERLKAIGAELHRLKFTRREAPAAQAPSPADAEPTWYEVLQVPETASEAEIRASYHRLLKQYHPDLHNESGFPWVKEQAHQMTRKIGAAYQALGSAEKRQSYDRELRRRRDGG
ncbi:MAG: DnaJ domain-containing protein [SAR324 cluster bacterium]